MTPVHRPELRDLVLELESDGDLFVPRAVDPLSQGPLYTSGMDTAMRAMRSRPNGYGRLVIRLPRAVDEEGLKEAIHRYCDLHIVRLEDIIACTRREGLSYLAIGLPFLIACLSLMIVVGGLEMPDYAELFVLEGLFIVGWVSLWRPIETLLYDWIPHRRDVRLLERIREMEMMVESADTKFVAELR